jgi:pimeloyl-ACP methyl ester carboxylesterase
MNGVDNVVQIVAGDLDVALRDSGPRDGTAVLLLHGWPYDVESFTEATVILVDSGFRVLAPYLRGYGATRFRSASVLRNGQQAAFAEDAVALLDALDIDRAVVAGFDWGARTANVLAALWPERCTGHVAVSGYLIGSPAANAAPLPPAAEFAWWYQFYFATERGRAGYAQYRREFARFIWQSASPRWHFDAATFDRSAASFDNPDHVDIVIHNYRWRLGLAADDPRYVGTERRLAARPTIAVPTITLEGDANGAPHPDPASYRAQFVGPYEHRDIVGGVGHNLAQEAPDAFAAAVADVHAVARESGWATDATHVG